MPNVANPAAMVLAAIGLGLVLYFALPGGSRRRRRRKGTGVDRTTTVVDGLTGTIGCTPMIELKTLSRMTGCRILAK